ncbi:MAG: hypothetical protein Kow0092_10420 [Deferrisomatales bacterium]
MTDDELRLDADALLGVLEALGEPVSVHDARRRVVYQNRSHRTRFGEAGGRPCHEVWFGRVAPCAGCPLERGEPYERVEAPEGGEAQCVRAVLTAGPNPRVVESAVPAGPGAASLEGWVRSVFARARDAVFLESLDGAILEVNPAAEALLGMERGELAGHSVADILPAETRREIPRVVRELQEKGSFRLEAWQQRKDGTRFLAEVEGLGFQGPSGPLALVRVRDATAARMDRKALEERCQEMEAFLYTVAHDLKTPLVSVKGYAALLARELEGGSAVARDHATRLLHGAERLETLLDDLLRFAQAAPTGDAAADLDAAAVARQAWEGLWDRVQEAGGSLELDEALPRVRLAPVHLEQIFMNLFSNALRYRREAVPSKVRVAAVGAEPEWRVRPGQVCLVVEDNGLGVEEEEREAVFELFRQGRTRRGGTGVGLAIVRRIVTGAGGRVWVESCPGEGSRFYLTLPAAKGRSGNGG